MAVSPRRALTRVLPSNISVQPVDNAKKRKLDMMDDEDVEFALRRSRAPALQSPPLTPTKKVLNPWNKRSEIAGSLDALTAINAEESNLLAQAADLSTQQGPHIDPAHRFSISEITKKLFDVCQQRLVALQSLALTCLDSEPPRLEPAAVSQPTLVVLSPLVLRVPQSTISAHAPRRLQARATLVSDSHFLSGGCVVPVDKSGLISFESLSISAEVIANNLANSVRIHLEAIVMPQSPFSLAQPVSSPITVDLPPPLSSPSSSGSSSPNPRLSISSARDDDVTHDIFNSFSSSTSLSSTPSTDDRPKKRARTDPDASMSPLIDITHLLPLPQKEAAARLGISESMLCKRFKECTQRKWPYRQLCKLDKAIAALLRSKKRGSVSTALIDEKLLVPNDLQKLRSLRKQRESILAPVQIRVTPTSDEVPVPMALNEKPSRTSTRAGRSRFNAEVFVDDDASSQLGDMELEDDELQEFEVQWQLRRDEDEDEVKSAPVTRSAKTRQVHEMDKMELAELEDDAAVVVLSLLSQGAML